MDAKLLRHTSMTDIFASEPSAPGGAPSESAQQPGDVTGTLAELERKLRELERELTSIGRRETPAPEPIPATPVQPPSPQPPAPQPTPPPISSQPSGRLVDEAMERSETFERVRPSDAQLASLAELRRFRDRLERFARELAAEYDALLGRVMTGLSTGPARATPAAPPPTSTAPAFTPQASPPPQQASPPQASPPPQQASPPQASPPPAPAVTPEAAAAEARENALFEGRVELGVGPFYDIASLGAFERRLASLPGVSEAAVRRFEASHAVVDVRLAAPVALVRELRRASGSDFSVREVASGRILLTFDES
jgi:hypothetical protein